MPALTANPGTRQPRAPTADDRDAVASRRTRLQRRPSAITAGGPFQSADVWDAWDDRCAFTAWPVGARGRGSSREGCLAVLVAMHTENLRKRMNFVDHFCSGIPLLTSDVSDQSWNVHM